VRARRLACRYWAGASPSEKSARVNIVPQVRERSGAAENKSLEIKLHWAKRRSVAACTRACAPRAPGAALLGQHARGVVSFPLRTSRGRGV
jgi:hypothetical protein